MERLLGVIGLLLISYGAFAQETKSQLMTRFDVIRNETIPGANTKTRIADAYQELADASQSILFTSALGTDTYTASILGVTAYTDLWVAVEFPNANTGTCSLNINSMGAITLKKDGGANLEADDIDAGDIHIVAFDGTNFQVLTLGGGGGGDALTSSPLSQFAATTSSQLAGVISDETGNGALVFATSPTLVTPALGTPSALVGTNITGTASGLTAGITNALKSATTTVDVSAATAPTTGQVLTATSGTAATWQDASGGVTSVTGTTNRITSSGGSTPSIDISSSYVGQASITTTGTLTTGATGSGFTVSLGTSTITGELPVANLTARYILDQATPSTAGSTITLDMNSQIQRMFVGSASFATAKTLALSNTTNALVFNFSYTVTNVAAVITMPSSFVMSDPNFDGDDWVPPLTGNYEMGGTFDGTNWLVKIAGPYN